MGQKQSSEEGKKYCEFYVEEHDKSLGYRLSLLINSGVQIIGGLISIIVWSYMLAETWDNRGHPITNSAGIWMGAIFLVPGILGVLAYMKKHVGLFSGHFYSIYGIISGNSQYVRLSVEAWRACSKPLNTPRGCLPVDVTERGSLICLIVSSILMVTCVVQIIYGVIILVRVGKARRLHYMSGQNNGMAPNQNNGVALTEKA